MPGRGSIIGQYAPVATAVRGIPDGIPAAYREALAGGRLSWASPAIFTVGAYIGFYALGWLLARPSPHMTLIAIAVGLGLIGLLGGIGLGWSVVSESIRLPGVDRTLLGRYGSILAVVGLAALGAYFIVIGYIPVLHPGLEQSRVTAAEQGGAPFRVLAMLALPGAWVLVATAIAERNVRGTVVAGAVVAVTALGFALTGNRSPAFTVVEVAVIVGLLQAGKGRLRARGVAALSAIALAFVVGAGVFGAIRLASGSGVDGPPAPGAASPNYVALTGVAIRGYLVVPIQNLSYTMDAVPERIGWRLGLTYLQPVLTALPGKQTTFDADLKRALNQRYAGGGTVPGLLGEAFANFGPFGWLLVPFLVGAAITALYRLTASAAPEMTALYGFAIAHVSIGGILSGLAVASPFPYEGYIALVLPVVGVQLVRRRRSQSSTSTHTA